jgi:hypothetical protein
MPGNTENQAGHNVPVGTSAILVHAGQVSTTNAGVLPVGGDQMDAPADSAIYRYPSPRPGTIRSGRIYLTTNMTGGGTYSVAIQINGVDALTLDVTRNGATGVLTIPGTASVAIGNLVSVRVNDTVNPGGIGLTRMTVSYELV